MKKIIGVGMVLMLVSIGMLSGCTDEEIFPSYTISEKIGNHVHIDYKHYYCLIGVTSINTSACLWMFSVALFNRTGGRFVSTLHGYYDDCKSQLYDDDFKRISEIRWE